MGKDSERAEWSTAPCRSVLPRRGPGEARRQEHRFHDLSLAVEVEAIGAGGGLQVALLVEYSGSHPCGSGDPVVQGLDEVGVLRHAAIILVRVVVQDAEVLCGLV